MARRAYRYEVSLRPVTQPDGSAATDAALTFQHDNHDDLLAIVERVRQTSGLEPESAAAMAVGLKLLTEVMLQERQNPLFAPLRDPMHEFIGGLKRLSVAGPGAASS